MGVAALSPLASDSSASARTLTPVSNTATLRLGGLGGRKGRPSSGSGAAGFSAVRVELVRRSGGGVVGNPGGIHEPGAWERESGDLARPSPSSASTSPALQPSRR